MNHNTIKGVNLGGWLVLEKWITPSLFSNTSATDEFSLCKYPKILELIKKHQHTFITEEDFHAIAAASLMAVRIPIGYWAFIETNPYPKGEIERLDWAMEQAHASGLRVLLDLHAAPGSQNGWDHSGTSGKIDWHHSAQNIDKSLATVRAMAERYASHPALWGIELLNEPHWSVPMDILIEYYRKGYQVVREYSRDVRVVVSDAFRHHQMMAALQNAGLDDVTLDSHRYQLFSASDRRLSAAQHIKKALTEWRNDIRQTTIQLPVIVGEWSAALDKATYAGIEADERQLLSACYSAAQQAAFSQADGWFYWSWKMQGGGDWSLKDRLAAAKRGPIL